MMLRSKDVRDEQMRPEVTSEVYRDTPLQENGDRHSQENGDRNSHSHHHRRMEIDTGRCSTVRVDFSQSTVRKSVGDCI